MQAFSNQCFIDTFPVKNLFYDNFVYLWVAVLCYLFSLSDSPSTFSIFYFVYMYFSFFNHYSLFVRDNPHQEISANHFATSIQSRRVVHIYILKLNNDFHREGLKGVDEILDYNYPVPLCNSDEEDWCEWGQLSQSHNLSYTRGMRMFYFLPAVSWAFKRFAYLL